MLNGKNKSNQSWIVLTWRNQWPLLLWGRQLVDWIKNAGVIRSYFLDDHMCLWVYIKTCLSENGWLWSDEGLRCWETIGDINTDIYNLLQISNGDTEQSRNMHYMPLSLLFIVCTYLSLYCGVSVLQIVLEHVLHITLVYLVLFVKPLLTTSHAVSTGYKTVVLLSTIQILCTCTHVLIVPRLRVYLLNFPHVFACSWPWFACCLQTTQEPQNPVRQKHWSTLSCI